MYVVDIYRIQAGLAGAAAAAAAAAAAGAAAVRGDAAQSPCREKIDTTNNKQT
jgi:hypothetical protein